jgi:NhaA family Na+:H+ antiporter
MAGAAIPGPDHPAARTDPEAPTHRLLRPVDPGRDHIRGGPPGRKRRTIVIYGDYLCPYCRRLGPVLDQLRETLGARMAYVFRHFPNERVHPGAEYVARTTEAANCQGRFWDMHDAVYQREPPLTEPILTHVEEDMGFEMPRFRHDLDEPSVKMRVDEDLADGRRNGVTGTPTLFVDGQRYDGAWDFFSLLEALDRPVGAQVQRTARAFANLPTSAGLVLLVAAAAALILANSPLAALYNGFVQAQIGIEVSGQTLAMRVLDWCSDGLLAIFFLIVGLEIRREMTSGSLVEPKAAAAPLLAALGGVIAPAMIFLLFNRGPTAAGWAIPIDTGLAFTIAVLAVLGGRASASLKAFVATYAVAEDVCVLLILAVFFPRELRPGWMAVSLAAVLVLFLLNRWRIYPTIPYLVVAAGLWLTLHFAGLEAAFTGILLAAFLPNRPAPAPTPLLAQAATALAELEDAERDIKRRGGAGRIEQEPIWDWASSNLSAAADRLLSPAERVERTLAPWSTYFALPLFAFTAAGVSLSVDLGSPNAGRVLWGVILGLALGKPIGIAGITWLAAKAKVAIPPADAAPLAFIGAAFLCGIGDPLSILVADQAFDGSAYSAVAKLGVFLGSLAAIILGTISLLASGRPVTQLVTNSAESEEADA